VATAVGPHCHVARTTACGQGPYTSRPTRVPIMFTGCLLPPAAALPLQHACVRAPQPCCAPMCELLQSPKMPLCSPIRRPLYAICPPHRRPCFFDGKPHRQPPLFSLSVIARPHHRLCFLVSRSRSRPDLRFSSSSHQRHTWSVEAPLHRDRTVVAGEPRPPLLRPFPVSHRASHLARRVRLGFGMLTG
jgi:hypothetical protein